MFTQNNFTDGIFSGLVSLDQNASSQFQPRLVMNDYSTGRKTALSDNGHLIGVGVGVEMLSTYPLEEAQLN